MLIQRSEEDRDGLPVSRAAMDDLSMNNPSAQLTQRIDQLQTQNDYPGSDEDNHPTESEVQLPALRSNRISQEVRKVQKGGKVVGNHDVKKINKNAAN